MDDSRTSTTEVCEAKKGWSKLKTLDGASRIYTFSVLTTLALGIVTVYFDAEFLHRNENDNDDVLLQKATPVGAFSAAGQQIIRALVLLLICIVIGACAFFLVAINVYPFERNQVLWQSWSLIAATISLVVTNILAVLAMYSAYEKYEEKKEDPNNYESGFSHFLLLISLILSMLIMDLSFLAAFTENKQYLEKNEKMSNWSIIRHRLASLRRAETEGHPFHSPTRAAQQPSLRARARDKGVKALKWLGMKAIELIAAIVEKLMEMLGMKKPENDRLTNITLLSSFSQDVSDAFLDITEFFVENALSHVIYATLSFLTWGLWAPWRRWMSKSRVMPENPGVRSMLAHRCANGIDCVAHFVLSFPERTREWIDGWYDDMREDETFEHSAWVLAAMCTSFVLLFYFGVKISTQVSGYLDEMYSPRRDCAVFSMEKNGELGNFIFRLAGFTENSRHTGDAASRIDDQALTDMACTISTPDSFTSFGVSIPQNITESDPQSIIDEALTGRNESLPDVNLDAHFYRCSTNDFSPNLCFSLLVINQLERNISRELNETIEPIEVFKDHGIGRTIYVIDRILRHTRWTVFIGLIFGLIVGIGSLMSVLSQYKRFSLAIRSGFFDDLHMSKNLAVLKDKEKNIERFEDVVTEREWSKLIEKYPMGSSVFFFGILVSTAVIQLLVFGTTVSLLLSLIVSIFNERVFAILRPYMALLIAFLITWLINGPIAQYVFCERFLVKKYQVLWELPFLAFLLIYTAVHLVLGVFFALMRLVWVMLTTIACLNRLDRNLFPIFKYNDLGHRSFMAMVLMQHAFLSNAEEDEKLPFHELVARLRQQPRPMPPSSSDAVRRSDTPNSPDMATLAQQAARRNIRGQTSLTLQVDDTPVPSTVPSTAGSLHLSGIRSQERSKSADTIPHYLRDDFDQGASSQPPV